MSLGTTPVVWDRLGREDPFWAVLTCFGKGRYADVDQFFALGKREAARTLVWAEDRVPDMGHGSALDFGCGVGRLTQPLGERFDAVVGVDVAPSMIERARSLNRHGDRVRYVLNQREDLSAIGSGFDFAVSLLTLQHIPPRAARRYLMDLVRVLRPGGVLVVQVPTRRVKGRLRQALKRFLPARFKTGTAGMLMHAMRPRAVRRLVRKAGGDVLDVREDDLSGRAWRGSRYLIRRH